jgi:hypothetical protein
LAADLDGALLRLVDATGLAGERDRLGAGLDAMQRMLL